jgi:4-hydroxy-2-oxoheptanedioate aldolase
MGVVQINRTKKKLLAGQPAFGYELAMGSPLVAEALARTGIDFLQIDNQHGDWGPDSTIAALMGIQGGSATPVARVARNDYTMVGRLLDSGVMGLVFPMVHTAEDAKAAADAARFPPRGTRSCGWGRVARNDPDYWDWIDDQVFVAVQIESITAVENAEAILSTPGVDGCWLGPSDLAFSMGIHPKDRATNDDHARAIERVLAACKNTGTFPGYAAASPSEALSRAKEGFQFLTAGSDAGFLLGGAVEGVKALGLDASSTSREH